MRIRLTFLALFAFLLAGNAFGQSFIITTTVTVTNLGGTTNGQTLTFNADTRTFTNAVSSASTQILTGTNINQAATNMFNAIADAPFAASSVSTNSTNGINLVSFPGVIPVATIGGSPSFGTITYATNSLTNAQVLRLPVTVENPTQRTNITGNLIAAINAPENTNQISQISTAAAQLAGLTNAQTISGTKNFTAFIGINPISTNLINYGNAISSPGSGSTAEQFGAGATSSGNDSVALGAQAGASSLNSISIGFNATNPVAAAGGIAIGANSLNISGASIAIGTAAQTGSAGVGTAIGSSAVANGLKSVSIGTAAGNGPIGTNGVSIGVNATNNFSASMAIGFGAATTTNNQIMLGSSGISVQINNSLTVGTNLTVSGVTSLGGNTAITGGLSVSGTVTNITFANTNNFPVQSDISFGRYALSSLATGNNADIPVGTNVFVEVSGPGGAFTINGINGQPNRDGKFIIILNRTGQNMTIANDSGVDATAANRIYCLTGADKSVTGNSAALLIYNANVTHWILLNFSQ